jgi:radical SAM enzyme (TIGR01210 family)
MEVREFKNPPMNSEANLASLSDKRFITEVAHPALSIIAGKVAENKAKERYLQKSNPSPLWSFLDLPPAPGSSNGALLICLMPMNAGCAHQAAYGGCIGCDYHPEKSDVTRQELDQQINETFIFINTGRMPDGTKKDDFYERFFSAQRIVLNIVASGSLLSPSEIPVAQREKIFKQVKEYKNQHSDKEIIFETECRIDDLMPLNYKTGKYEINYPVLESLKSLGMLVQIGVGVESTNPIVSEGCFNKHLPPMVETIKLLEVLKKDYPQINLLPHIWLGAPFLTEKERIDDAVESINDCISNGLTDRKGRVIMMVMNKRRLSALGDVYDNIQSKDISSSHLSLLPSIWSAGEALRRLGKNNASRVMVRGFTTSDETAQIVKPCGQTDKEIALYKLVKSWRGTDSEWGLLQNIYQNRDLECSHRINWEKSINKSEESVSESPSFKENLIKWYKMYLKELDPKLDLGTAIEDGKKQIMQSRAISYSRTMNPKLYGLN